MTNKILNIKDLKDYCATKRKRGARIVLAHGTFDLLHVGHIKHLKFAKKYGEILIVTITADVYVKKGPQRPYFNQLNRAEMIASLDFVDRVSIINNASAIPAIQNVKPNYYIKGLEYKDKKNDLTNKINLEIKALKKNNGKVIYSNEETFSSSRLLNNFFSGRTQALKNKLKNLNQKNLIKKILDASSDISDLKICLIGDTIFDVYKYVSPMGKSPKENVISNLLDKEDAFCGGVLAAANNISSFNKKIHIVTNAYNSNDEKKLVKKSLDKNIKVHNFSKNDAPVTTKIRYLEKGFNKKLFSVYKMNDKPVFGKHENKIINFLKKNLSKFDLVIVTDFGHGFISEKIIQTIKTKSKFLCVNAQSNSANYGFNIISKYKKSDYACIDLPEAKLAIKNRFKDPAEIILKEIPKVFNSKTFALTLGKNGSILKKIKKFLC